MIKFENGMLVLDASATEEDVQAINQFAAHQKQQAVKVIKQRFVDARDKFAKVENADYFWSTSEIMGVIDGRLDGIMNVYYDDDYVGNVPDGAIKL